MTIFSIKCYFRANLKIDATKNRLFWSISPVKSKPEIHSNGTFLLARMDKLAEVLLLLKAPDGFSGAFSCQFVCWHMLPNMLTSNAIMFE